MNGDYKFIFFELEYSRIVIILLLTVRQITFFPENVDVF